MHPRSRITAGALAAVVVLAACGNTDDGSTDTAAPAQTFETSDATQEVPVDAAAPAEPEPEPAPDATPAPEPEPDAGDVGEPEAPAITEPAAAPATDPPPVEVQPAVLGGRAFAEGVEASSEVETNILPSVVVDDVGRGTKANWRNIFPADRPILLWLWAPH